MSKASAPRRTSPLLINESPLQVLPSLAAAIGLNPAIVAQQIHYWLGRSEHVRDGRAWVYKTLEEWGEEFPFWSVGTIRRALEVLREMGLVLTEAHGANPLDRTLWYSLDYDVLDSIWQKVQMDAPNCRKRQITQERHQGESAQERQIMDEAPSPFDQLDQMPVEGGSPCDQNDQMDVITLITCSISETTLTETTNNISLSASEAQQETLIPAEDSNLPAQSGRKKRAPKRAASGPPDEQAEAKAPPEVQIMFERLCYILNGHQNYAALTEQDRAALGKEAKHLRQTVGATADDLAVWFKQVWRVSWRGERNQKPTVKQLRNGLAEYVEKGRSAAACLEAPQGANGNGAGAQVNGGGPVVPPAAIADWTVYTKGRRP